MVSRHGVTTFASYNPAGEPITTTNPAGKITTIDYDGLGRACCHRSF